MASGVERARRHEGKSLSMPQGEREEINGPIISAGETGYVKPRDGSPKTQSNSGDRPKGKSGKNY